METKKNDNYRKKTVCSLLAAFMLAAGMAAVNVSAVDTVNNKENIQSEVYEDFGYIQKNETICITSYNGNDSNPVIPSEINNLPVTKIGEAAFRFCDSLIKIEIPESVQEIGEYSFCACQSLKEIELSNSVKIIRDGAFSGCCELTKINLTDSIENMGIAAFRDCKNLIDVNIPNRITEISEEMFFGCEMLKKITIPNNITKINSLAFGDCKYLKEIEMPNNTSYIDGAAFKNCRKLKDIFLPKSLSFIDSNAFTGCTSLKNITVDEESFCYSSKDGVLFDKNKTTLIFYPTAKTGNYKIPKSVIKIADCAFCGCKNIEDIYIPDGVTSIGNLAFEKCDNLSKITIPDTVKEIAGNAFDNDSYYCDKLTIYGAKGSYAEEYAKKFGISFVSLNNENSDNVSKPDNTISSEVNNKSNTADGKQANVPQTGSDNLLPLLIAMSASFVLVVVFAESRKRKRIKL